MPNIVRGMIEDPRKKKVPKPRPPKVRPTKPGGVGDPGVSRLLNRQERLKKMLEEL